MQKYPFDDVSGATPLANTLADLHGTGGKPRKSLRLVRWLSSVLGTRAAGGFVRSPEIARAVAAVGRGAVVQAVTSSWPLEFRSAAFRNSL